MALAGKLTKQNVHHALFGDDRSHLYAVIDGAAAPGLLDALYIHHPEWACLYRGKLEPDMAETAPYLARLEPGGAFTQWIIDQGWQKHWGIFAASREDLRKVRRHFRTFLHVLDPKSRNLYFRYYDPRVLAVYLPTCNAGELEFVFGPLQAYFLEGDRSGVLLKFSRNRNALREERIDLNTNEAQ